MPPGFQSGSRQSQCWNTPVRLRLAVRSVWRSQATSTASTCSRPVAQAGRHLEGVREEVALGVTEVGAVEPHVALVEDAVEHQPGPAPAAGRGPSKAAGTARARRGRRRRRSSASARARRCRPTPRRRTRAGSTAAAAPRRPPPPATCPTGPSAKGSGAPRSGLRRPTKVGVGLVGRVLVLRADRAAAGGGGGVGLRGPAAGAPAAQQPGGVGGGALGPPGAPAAHGRQGAAGVHATGPWRVPATR